MIERLLHLAIDPDLRKSCSRAAIALGSATDASGFPLHSL